MEVKSEFICAGAELFVAVVDEGAVIDKETGEEVEVVSFCFHGSWLAYKASTAGSCYAMVAEGR